MYSNLFFCFRYLRTYLLATHYTECFLTLSLNVLRLTQIENRLGCITQPNTANTNFCPVVHVAVNRTRVGEEDKKLPIVITIWLSIPIYSKTNQGDVLILTVSQEVHEYLYLFLKKKLSFNYRSKATYIIISMQYSVHTVYNKNSRLQRINSDEFVPL